MKDGPPAQAGLVYDLFMDIFTGICYNFSITLDKGVIMTPKTDARMTKIKTRLDAATPGPWYPVNNFGSRILNPHEVFGAMCLLLSIVF